MGEWFNFILKDDCCHLSMAAATIVSLYTIHRLYSRIFKVDSGKMDKTIETWLESKWSPSMSPQYDSAPPSKGTEKMIAALEGMAPTDDPDECAGQMRKILRSAVLPYSTLIDEPEHLMRVSPGNEAQNGALWTRFTVQYNLYAGSIVALGNNEQRQQLVASQNDGALGCFAFTEKGTGVLSGAGVETTATFDPTTNEFVIQSPNVTSSKNWISQGMYAENAVILADLIIDGDSKGPHLFWAHIADAAASGGKSTRGRTDGPLARPTPVAGVTIGTNPEKTCMHGLDNATVLFEQFRVPGSALLSRFCSLTAEGKGNAKTYTYATNLPNNCKRMLDLLIFRLLTGRIVLSEATMSYSVSRLRRSFMYTKERELWRGRKDKGQMMADMPLIKTFFRDYGRTSYIIQAFIAHTREKVADSIRNDHFTFDTVEATCMCKYLGTGFGLDLVDATRKTMCARGLQADSWLGADAFLPLATCAAEGDNTIMELKIVQDLIRGRTSKLPLGLITRTARTSQGRRAAGIYLAKLANAMALGVRALKAGQLLRDIAWARTHLRVIDVWIALSGGDAEKMAWLDSYESVLMRFPTPHQH